MFIRLTSFLSILCLTIPAESEEIFQINGSRTGDPVKTIVIDAGHGGHDPGCLGSDSQEKKITLKLPLTLRDQIKSRFPDVKIVLTRDKDVFVPLHTRSAIANEARADLFISLHCNAVPPASSGISGSETYVLGLHRAQDNFAVAQRENGAILLEDNHQLNYGDFDPNSAEAYILMTMYQNAYLDKSIVFADLVEKAVEQHGKRTSKGVKQAGFLVLRENAMPSVLVETGFLTNASDQEFLNSEEGQLRMAESLAIAFADYKSLMETGEITRNSQPPNPAHGSASNKKDTAPAASKPPAARPAEKESHVLVPVKVVDQTKKQETKPTPATGVKDTKSEWFGIQMGAFSQKLPADHPMRKDVHPLMERAEKGLYKYIAGPFPSQEAAEKVKNSLVQSGYKGIFTVAFRGEERIG
ncbi:MAG: N-acetylmuramoyl-L-alanine amidase [Saprospiraceae bacterium]|nr:N-acetylmuramoyl-L-alanine amidase [Saprospiraceae bacterium]